MRKRGRGEHKLSSSICAYGLVGDAQVILSPCIIAVNAPFMLVAAFALYVIKEIQPLLSPPLSLSSPSPLSSLSSFLPLFVCGYSRPAPATAPWKTFGKCHSLSQKKERKIRRGEKGGREGEGREGTEAREGGEGDSVLLRRI